MASAFLSPILNHKSLKRVLLFDSSYMEGVKDGRSKKLVLYTETSVFPTRPHSLSLARHEVFLAIILTKLDGATRKTRWKLYFTCYLHLTGSISLEMQEIVHPPIKHWGSYLSHGE